ncbi:hypothetical protein [Sphingomonas sp. TREG-RG-20F-R18-01]|uniref:hypothetical protein n=1 Tax=Sphingomonas sp. TREG-RG-20F-R18-01 TaxID=2914982 RepID=UPI001F56A2FB|nr:hypothetical protein [Sphingomonas sp. TREG-RG-20F-R18-01]
MYDIREDPANATERQRTASVGDAPLRVRSACAPLTPIPAPVSATMGLWECDLLSHALAWSDGVYDLFGLPRGVKIDRREIAGRYTRQSRIDLELARLEAIRDCTGFMLDAQIEVSGGARWIRIVAQAEAVDGKAVRLFGSKHDVTFERALWAAQGRALDVKPCRGPSADTEPMRAPVVATTTR